MKDDQITVEQIRQAMKDLDRDGELYPKIKHFCPVCREAYVLPSNLIRATCGKKKCIEKFKEELMEVLQYANAKALDFNEIGGRK